VRRLAAAPGWYTASLPDHWSFKTPSGGVLMSVALAAMRAELADPELRATSANTLFCSPVPAGPLEVRVEVLRRSGSAAQLRAALSSTALPGPGLEVSATFTRERPGPDVIDVDPPEVPGPEASRVVDETAVPFFRNFESKLALGHSWRERGWTAGPARYARWLRYLVPPLDAAGFVDPIAVPPIADLMPPSLRQKLGPDHQELHAPSLDLTVHWLERSRSPWWLAASHCRRARGGTATADIEIWDPDRRLVAVATQTMMLRRRAP
jgi:acyl-CoA thioesterase